MSWRSQYFACDVCHLTDTHLDELVEPEGAAEIKSQLQLDLVLPLLAVDTDAPGMQVKVLVDRFKRVPDGRLLQQRDPDIAQYT